MNFREFADQWIEENVNDGFYSNMSVYVRDFVALVIRQHHSGVSVWIYMRYLYQLLNDYEEQNESSLH